MVLDEDFEVAEHHALLQNKTSIQNNVLAKRKEQLKHWEGSEMNKLATTRPSRHESKVKFQDSDVFLSACVSGDEEEVEELLEKGANINVATIDGVTALHQAVIDDNLDIVRFLVEHKADINAQDNEGWTPLHAAVCCGSLPIARYLCEKGADLTLTNSDKELALDLAEDDDLRQFLEEEIRLKTVDVEKCRDREFNMMMNDCAEWIRVGKYLDIPHPKTGATALHVAASKGYNQLIGMLIRAGADVNIQDYEGWTPLHAAAHWAEKDACRILMENGASLNSGTHNGQTVLNVADKSIVEYLENLQQKLEELRSDALQQQQEEQRSRESTKTPSSSGSMASSVMTASSSSSQSSGVIAAGALAQAGITLPLPTVADETEEPKNKMKREFSPLDENSTGPSMISQSPKTTSQPTPVAASSVLSRPGSSLSTTAERSLMPPPASTTAHKLAQQTAQIPKSTPMGAPPLAQMDNDDDSEYEEIDEEVDEEEVEEEELSVETVTASSSKSTSKASGSASKSTPKVEKMKEKSRTPSIASGISGGSQETECSCETVPESSTGSQVSSIETSSREVTPKEASSSLYSSDQNVECTVRVPGPARQVHTREPPPFSLPISSKAGQQPTSLSTFHKSRQQFIASATGSQESPLASPITPSTHRGSAHSTPTRNFFMSNSRQNSNNYNEMMFGRADSRESAREERGAPLARITSPSASDSTQSASQSPSPSPTVTATVMSHRKNSAQVTPPTQPISHKESESERRVKAKEKRNSRRSTQGITLEQVGEAARQASASVSSASSSTEDFGRWKSSALTQQHSSGKEKEETPSTFDVDLESSRPRPVGTGGARAVGRTASSAKHSQDGADEDHNNSAQVQQSRQYSGTTPISTKWRQRGLAGEDLDSNLGPSGVRMDSASLSSVSTTGSVNTSAYLKLPSQPALNADNRGQSLTSTSSSYSSSSGSGSSYSTQSQSTPNQSATFTLKQTPQATLPAATPSAAKLNRRSQLIRGNRRGTGPVDMEAISAANSTHTIEGRENEAEIVPENGSKLHSNPSLDSIGKADTDAFRARSDLSKTSSKGSMDRKESAESTELQRYRLLYERQKEENQQLRQQVDQLNQKLVKKEGVANGNVSTGVGRRQGGYASAMDDQERRQYERRISALEYELEVARQLEAENNRLKAENEALIRVLSKISRQDPAPTRRLNNFNPTTKS
ncbi:ankyrin repeats (3 copies) domain-containing protein [Ditylenchus destructor]|uniref:Protein phosphatase 1 regulatory subunit 12B n=1 Tax=Ditylenchus destructor TaxID=166010 RepID=A0AAD4N6A3_9BILA|nr:ankyrin repeats (3 copies) domain-containing protein [Ditylenchus destructor]